MASRKTSVLRKLSKFFCLASVPWVAHGITQAAPSAATSEVLPWYGKEKTARPLYLMSPESLPRGVGGCPILEKNSNALCSLEPKELALLQDQILRSYSLPGVVPPPADPERPEGWVDPWKDPTRALETGIPVRLKRKEPAIVQSFMTLPVLSSFKGDSETISRLNTALEYWHHKKFAESERLLGDLVDAVKPRTAGDPERMLVNLISGFYWLETLTKVVLDGEVREEPVATLRSKARQGFLEGIVKVNPNAYADKVTWGLDRGLFSELLNSSVFLDEDHPKPLKRRRAFREQRSIEPTVWIRSVAPIALFNAVSLSRSRGLYGKAFDAAEVLDSVVKAMMPEIGTVQENDGAVFTSDAGPQVAKALLIRPRSLADLEAITLLVRADVLKKQTIESMLLLDKAVRSATSKEISAIGFAAMASVFYDRGNDFWSRRLYAWSELMAPDLVQRFPDSLLWGTESTFWRGDYVRAQRAFEQLRLHLSDPEYGPNVNLRLLELELWLNEDAAAEASLARLQTHYGASIIGPDLNVLDFCRTVEHLTPKLRKIEFERVREEIKESRYELRERAAACLLRASLLEQEDNNKRRDAVDGFQVNEDANAQLNLLKTFDQDFPESPYRVLFDDRESRLRLSPVFASLASNRCPDVIAFYLAHEKELQATAVPQASDPVKGLNWTQKEMDKTLRCAAFLREEKVWRQLRDPKQSENSVANLVYRWREAPSDVNLIALRAALVQLVGWKIFDARLNDLEATNVALLDDQEFWTSLARAEVLAAEPQEPEHPFFDEPFTEVLLQGVGAKSAVDLQSVLCSWAQKSLRVSGDALTEKLLEFSKTEWLKTISTKDGLNMGPPEACFTRLKSLALAASVRQPHPKIDQFLLWPFIEHVGPLLQPELAFDLAKRSFERTRQPSEQVIRVMEKLALESPDPALESASKKWLRDHQTKVRRSVW